MQFPVQQHETKKTAKEIPEKYICVFNKPTGQQLLTKNGSTVRYVGAPQFLLRGTVRFFCDGTGTVRWYGTLFCNGTGTVRWYAV